MCNFLSAIITKNDVFYDFDHDEHEALVTKHKLNDKKNPPKFVRVEYVPTDIWDEKKPWVFRVDQDIRPEWFSEKQAEKIMERLKKLFYKSRVIRNKADTTEIKEGRWYIIGSRVEARENSSVVARGNSSVEARENSRVVAWENSSVVARGNSRVEARENSRVEAWENSSVVAWGNSRVEAWENSITRRGLEIIVANPEYKLVIQKESNVKGI